METSRDTICSIFAVAPEHSLSKAFYLTCVPSWEKAPTPHGVGAFLFKLQGISDSVRSNRLYFCDTDPLSAVFMYVRSSQMK
jgi:hypothetical protein